MSQVHETDWPPALQWERSEKKVQLGSKGPKMEDPVLGPDDKLKTRKWLMAARRPHSSRWMT